MQSNSDYHYILKFALLGTDQAHHLKRDLVRNFNGGQLGSLGLEYNTKKIQSSHPVRTILLQLWSADNEYLSRLYLPASLRHLNCAVIVYDMACPDIAEIKKYIDLMRKHYAEHEHFPLLAVLGLQSGSKPPKSALMIQELTKLEGAFWREGINASSVIEIDALFREIAALELSRLKINLTFCSDLQEKQRLQKIWDAEGNKEDDKIMAVLTDYCGNEQGIARFVSFFSDWHKKHKADVKYLADNLAKKTLSKSQVVHALELMNIHPGDDPVGHMRRFLLEHIELPVHENTMECISKPVN